jgi:hypothetical protein
MDNLNGSGHRFWQGAFIGFIGWGGLLFHAGFGYWIDAIAKMISSSVLAGVTGLATMLFTDYYRYKIKKKLFKTKKDKDEKDKEKAA